ncbi:SRPBCC family protein [Nocardioides sp. T5]|uniref:SRPBCC family protein n=1 Tax=Nocardioides sp. T5 TaxID=3400182 RepID=UPI003A84F0E0
MSDVEFEIQRTVAAPIGEVFARLADIEGHNTWVPGRGSILRGTRQTSPGPVTAGTTYEDRTRMGTMPGEIAELDAPNRIVYHWWDRGSSGKTRMEGWPGYTLEAVGERETRVRHDVRLRANGIRALGTPVLRIIAHRERTATMDALVRSFATPPG